MKPIIYFPKDKNSIEKLQKSVAKIHAQVIIAKINSLSIPLNRKKLLIDEIIKDYIIL